MVEDLDELEDRWARGGSRGQALAVHELFLERAEEAFRDRIVLALPGPRELRTTRVLSAALAPLRAGARRSRPSSRAGTSAVRPATRHPPRRGPSRRDGCPRTGWGKGRPRRCGAQTPCAGARADWSRVMNRRFPIRKDALRSAAGAAARLVSRNRDAPTGSVGGRCISGCAHGGWPGPKPVRGARRRGAAFLESSWWGPPEQQGASGGLVGLEGGVDLLGGLVGQGP